MAIQPPLTDLDIPTANSVLGGVFKIRGHRLKTEHRCAYSLGYRIS